MSTFFTSDTHLNHSKINRYSQRPFGHPDVRDASIPWEDLDPEKIRLATEEMNETIIARWNERVGPRDTVYHLGDFSLAVSEEFVDAVLARLNGIIHFIEGNHDPKAVLRHKRWASVSTMKAIRVEGQRITLCHYPMLTWNKSHHGTALMLHGHEHGGVPPTSQRLDVGTDCWDFRPVTLEEIKERAAAAPPHPRVGHHTGDR